MSTSLIATETANRSLNVYVDCLHSPLRLPYAGRHFRGLSAGPSALARPRTLSEILGIAAPGRLLERIRNVMTAATAHGHRSGGAGSSKRPDTTAKLDASSLTMEELVKEHADAVYRVALSVTRDPVLAEDASQEALIKAWQALPSFRGEAPIRHWILRITHNVSISLLRRRREEVISPLDLPDRASSDPSVELLVEDRLAIDRFEAALTELDGISRSIVVLREVEGLSYAEMSDVLDLPLPTIRTRLLRARRQLATALDGWQP